MSLRCPWVQRLLIFSQMCNSPPPGLNGNPGNGPPRLGGKWEKGRRPVFPGAIFRSEPSFCALLFFFLCCGIAGGCPPRLIGGVDPPPAFLPSCSAWPYLAGSRMRETLPVLQTLFEARADVTADWPHLGWGIIHSPLLSWQALFQS